MANKYLIHGATYCGTGTSSAEATSNGGTGAWNNINVLEGTAPAYGSLAAGDTVYIRSKTSAGADITRTLSSANVTLGSSSATSANWITWVLDAGAVWSGINGTLTYECPAAYKTLMISYNRYLAEGQDKLVIRETGTTSSYKEYGTAMFTHLRNIFFDFTTGGCTLAEASRSVFENLHIVVSTHLNSLIRCSANSKLTIINPDIELLDPATATEVFRTDSSGSLEIYGGQVRGAGAVAGVKLNVVYDIAKFQSIGLQFPKAMIFGSVSDTNSLTCGSIAVGVDGGSGSAIREPWGTADSRNDNNYPSLNATLPDAVETGWSWKICPLNPDFHKPVKLAFSKYFTETAASRVITLELAIADTLTNVNARSVWMTVSYIDNSTGQTKQVSTYVQGGSALTTSSAEWSALTYGPVTLLPRKLVVTTPSAIKQDTPVLVTFMTTIKSASIADFLNDVLFVCPDFTVVAP